MATHRRAHVMAACTPFQHKLMVMKTREQVSTDRQTDNDRDRETERQRDREINGSGCGGEGGGGWGGGGLGGVVTASDSMVAALRGQ